MPLGNKQSDSDNGRLSTKKTFLRAPNNTTKTEFTMTGGGIHIAQVTPNISNNLFKSDTQQCAESRPSKRPGSAAEQKRRSRNKTKTPKLGSPIHTTIIQINSTECEIVDL